jgi:prolyl-tRNA editing enzyme YbaK/EbsC (Cys-tRNA(Pro) deacylase)
VLAHTREPRRAAALMLADEHSDAQTRRPTTFRSTSSITVLVMAEVELLHPLVRDAVAATGAAFEVMACDPALADTAAFVAAYGIPLDRSANTILVASKGAQPTYVACVLLATTSLDVNNVVRREMGVRKASFARAEPTMELTGMEIGGVTPFGLPDALPVLVDARAMEPDWIILGGGNRSSKLRLAPDALRALPLLRVVDGLATERRAE